MMVTVYAPKHCLVYTAVTRIIYTFYLTGYGLVSLSGKAFNNTQTIHYAASNIISAIMFGKRFEYKDPVFQAMVARDHESIRLTGSASILVQCYSYQNLKTFLKNKKLLHLNPRKYSVAVHYSLFKLNSGSGYLIFFYFIFIYTGL